VTERGLSVTAFHSGAGQDAEDLLSPFGKLAGTGSGSIDAQRFCDLQRRSDNNMRWGRRYYAKGGFIHDVSDNAIAALIDLIGDAPTADCELYVLQLGGAVSDVAEDATAYSGRTANFYWIAEPVWDDPAQDDKCIAWGRKAGARFAEMSSAGNYVNEQGDVGHEVAIRSYGKAKYDRLARLKVRFDPSNIFRLNQNIAPAASVRTVS
jgi:hypothetical protein